MEIKRMEIKRIERSDIPLMVKDKYKELLDATKELDDSKALEITLSEDQPVHSLLISLYRMARNAGLKISITQRTIDGKVKLYLYLKKV